MSGSGVLIISDFHLGPGRESREFEHFDDDEAFCDFLGHYGAATDLEQLELIIAGDFFDSIQVRIENVLPDRVYSHHALAKIKRIVSGHPKAFQALGTFSRLPGRSLTFLVGNHDPATIFTEVQDYLRDVLKGRISFESKMVSRRPLLVKHGNEWDAANRFENDAILSRDARGQFVRFPWGSYLVIDFVNRIRNRVPDIDRIKPVGAFIRWAFVHRPRDAAFAVLHFSRFVLRYRFHPERDQRIPIGKLRRMLKGTCHSCNLIQQASAYLLREAPSILVVGHTHRAMFHRISEHHIYVNAGTWNPILVFDRGKFRSVQYRTYALFQPDSTEPTGGKVELLQWIPGKGVASFEPTFFNVHMHPKMDGLMKRAAIMACVVWLVLMTINQFQAIFMERKFSVFLSVASLLNFLVPFTVSLYSRLIETKSAG